MNKDWLRKRITVAEAEAAHMVRTDRPDWRALLAQMQAGDELWEFSSSRESWQHLAGRAGIALVGNGEVVASIVTLLS